MLKMRLQRIGRKNNPSYRVIVTDSRNPAVRGREVDLLGSFDPKAGRFEIDAEKAKYWLSKGVQPSGTVHNFLVSKKIIDGKKINVLPRKSPIVDEAKLKADKVNGDKVNAESGEGDMGQAREGALEQEAK
jgi:small subunit ribosomal protein S16